MGTALTTTGPSMGLLNPKNQRIQKWFGFLPAIGLGLVAWYYIVPVLLGMAVMTVKLGLLAGLIGSIAYLAFNGKVRWMLGYLVQRTLDGMLSMFVRRDPVSIRKYVLERLGGKIELMEGEVAKVRGGLKANQRALSDYQREIAANEQIVAGAKAENRTSSLAAMNAARAVLRRQQAVDTITKEIAAAESALKILDLTLDAMRAKQADMADEIQQMERERKRVQSMAIALRTAAQIFKGNSIDEQMDQLAVDTNEDQVTALMGEIDQWVIDSRSTVEAVSLQRSGAVEQVLARIQQRAESSPLLLGHTPNDSTPLPAAEPREKVPVGLEIDNFLANNR